MEAIEQGCLPKSSRSEIVSAMHTRIIQHSDFPSPYEYRTACRRLVDKFPLIADISDTGYVSKLCMYKHSVVCTCVGTLCH